MFSKHMQMVLLLPVLWAAAVITPPAHGIYIDPAPGIDPLPNATHPAAGIVGDNLGPGGALREYCSGSLLASNILPANSFVLTAGHCVENGPIAPPLVLIGNTNGRFRVSGPGGAVQASDRVRRHTDYGFPSNDVAIMRLDSLVGAVAPLSLRRTALTVGDPFTAVGFGHTGYAGGTTNTGFPTKREATFTLGALGTSGPAGVNDYTFPNGAGPLRHICQGDSGGPSLFAGEIGGVHSYVENPGAGSGFSPCDGNNTSNGDADVTEPFLHNWIDSYSRRANFWDQLEMVYFPPPLVLPVPLPGDDFEVLPASRGLSVLSPGWTLGAATVHPILGPIPPDPVPVRYRYINSIGVANDLSAELFVDGVSAQGVVELLGGPAVIQKTFTVPASPLSPTNFCVRVQQRWNSLSLGADVGLAVPATMSLAWGGLSYATAGDLDTWQLRGVCNTIPPGVGPMPVVVKLLTVPEPAVGFLLIGLGISFISRSLLRRAELPVRVD